MPIKKFATLEEIDEARRGDAIELKDGSFALEELTDPALGDAGKKALDAMKAAKKEAERLRDEAIAERDRLAREQKARDQGASEAELQRIRDAEAEERKPIIAERDTLKEENRKLKLTDRVRALWIKHGGHPDREEDAMAALDKRTDLGDEGGIVYKDKGGAVTADDAPTFFKKFKEEKPWFFRGSGSSGGGASGSDGSEGDVPAPKTAEAVREQKRREIASSL